ncbi:MAG: hypothetical protein ACTSP4_07020 [Candidatus Hodarchaeales archaeon]
MVNLIYQPSYFATLYGSLIAGCNVEKGRELSKRDMFSSKDFFEKLNEYYSCWRDVFGHTIPRSDETTLLNALGLFIPWINTLAGQLPPETKDNNELTRLFKNLITQIQTIQEHSLSVDWEWSGLLLEFQLRKGSLSWEEVIEMLEPVIPVMKSYNDEFYCQFWRSTENKYYSKQHDKFLPRQYQQKIKQGADLLYRWTGKPPRSEKIRICSNRFFGEINSTKSHWSIGFGLHGCATIHIAPEFLKQPELLFHELSHVFLGDPEPFVLNDEIARVAEQMISYAGLEESPVPFWSIKELLQHEIEEILADFLTGETMSRVFPQSSIKLYYAENEPLLKPIFERLREYSSLLEHTEIREIIHKALADWEYKL